jgi:hypothetical protein
VKVKVKNFAVEMEIKTTGMELEVRRPNDSEQVGDCYVTKTGLTWCKGKTTKPKGVKISWDELGQLLASNKTKEAGIRAAKAESSPD